MSTSPVPQERGARIAGRYLVQRKLGAGSLGSVYLALDEATRSRIALKVIRGDRLTSRAVAGLQAEFETFAALRHPQIARAFDFGYLEPGGAPFYTREYVPGVPLRAGPPTSEAPREFLRPVLDLLDALDYLHGEGLLHLDVHAGNLIAADDPRRGAVLIDFGVVRSFAELGVEASRSLGGLLPPELGSRKSLGPPADLYMAGLLLLHRLTGRASGDARLPAEIPGWGPRLTLDLERIIAKALHSAPERRFLSARELRDALDGALGGAARPRSVGAPSERLIGRSRELAVLDSALARLAKGASSVLCLCGSAGSGKSRLLAEVGLRARLLGLAVIETQCAAGPEANFLAALRAARGRSREGYPWLEALETRQGGSPAERARKAAEAFFAEEGPPLIVILDDADRADRETVELTTALVDGALAAPEPGRKARSLCLVASGTHAPFAKRRGLERLQIKPLPSREAVRLVEEALRPLRAPPRLLARMVAAAGRSPLRLRRAAAALRESWGAQGVIPEDAPLPDLEAGAAALPAWIASDPIARAVLFTLAVAARPCREEEVAAGAGLAAGAAREHLRRLEAAEVVTAAGGGRSRRYRLRAEVLDQTPGPALPAHEARRLHARLAEQLAKEERLAPRDQAHLARHLILSGALAAGRERAFRAAVALRREGLHGPAVTLLQLVFKRETSLRRRFAAAEAWSETLEETGDHGQGIALLEPFRSRVKALPAERRVRFWRLLGVHYHRGGFPDQAREAFEKLERQADPARDVEDLVFADSELAELSTYRGLYGPAEEACLRGLERLGSSTGDFRRRMEIILRASLGHLKLRRLALEDARADLKAARDLARGQGRTALEVVILNNLGIAERQLNRFGAAKAAFRAADRLLARGGEGRSLVKIACNLALIAAEEGDAAAAAAEMERAGRLSQRYPGQRIEFFAGYTRGVVAELLGDPAAAAEALAHALAAGRKLGDGHLVGFGEVILAEAHLLCGRYARAVASLRRAARGAGPPLLRRMAAARLLLAARLLGNRRAATAAARLLDSAPRAMSALPEAWNDVFIAAAASLGGEPARPLAESALVFFEQVGVPAGVRFARAVLLADALARKDGATAARLARGGERPGTGSAHGVLRILEPLLLAKVRLAQGDLEGAERLLALASGASVGSPCLELDWTTELLRAQAALRRGDRGSARSHVHRSLHVRGLLLELVPAAARKSFLSHPRFKALEDAAARVERPPGVVLSTARLEDGTTFAGMVGSSTAMLRIFALIDRLRDQELPVLIRGETGTGKELAARALHASSARARGPFLALHCASVPEELFAAELFGHQAGAFTGADVSRPGILEDLAGGTLLLDDLEHLSLASQAKLLQALGSGRARRLGASSSYSLEVRILASTSADLEQAVERGAFRADLYFRLRAVELVLPPLRERRGDVPILARHFVQVHAARLERPAPAIAGEAIAALEAHAWPGNVRELESILLKALFHLSPGVPLTAGAVRALLPPPRPAPAIPEELMAGRTFAEWKREAERAYVTRLFRDSKGDLGRMMAALGIKRTQLYALFARLGLDPRRLREEATGP